MVPTRHFATLVCALALLHAPVRGAVLIHEYALGGSLEDQTGGNALTALGGQITSLGYVFAPNQGLQFSSSLLDPSNYSIELSFRLDDISGDGKIVDFQNLASNAGLYQISGNVDFFPTTGGGGANFAAGENVHVVLTRDATTEVVTAYVNGQPQFVFADTKSLAVALGTSPRLTFFADDYTSGQAQAAAGTVNYLRVFSGALSATDVSALYAAGPPLAIPEPQTVLLLSLGTAGVLWMSRRRAGRR